MKLSESRILTSHVGSLPRSAALLKMLLTMEQGGAVERDAFRTQVATDMADIIRHQAEAGIDVAGTASCPASASRSTSRTA